LPATSTRATFSSRTLVTTARYTSRTGCTSARCSAITS
jgi:hypothetical protein